MMAILALLVIGGLVTRCARPSQRKEDPREITVFRIGILAATVREFQVQKNRLATSLVEVVGWKGLDPRMTNDAWGRPFIFTPFDPTVGCGTLKSFGADGVAGGFGESLDLQGRIR
jgi:hypothetical protein